MHRNAPRASPQRYEAANFYDEDMESPSSTSLPLKYKRYSFISTKEWLFEYLTSAASLALLILIGVIFVKMDGKPLSDWGDTISLNATIAILTTLSSAALMHGVSEFIGQLKWLHFKKRPQKLSHLEKFDEASRGPWGSLLFIAKMKWNLATLGAIITISRLAFAPLAQQVIALEDRYVPTADDSVTFGYSHSYGRGLKNEMFNHRQEAVPQDPGMQAAIIQGLYDIGNIQDFNCPSAECRWNGTYISLGFKTACKDITQETLRTKDCVKLKGEVITQCNMTTPGGLGITTETVDTDSATTYYMNATALVGKASDTIMVDTTPPELTKFAIYRASVDASFRSHGVNITDCSLSLTAYEYQAARSNGTEFTFDKTREADFGQDKPWVFDPEGDAAWGKFIMNASTPDNIPELSIDWGDIAALQNLFQSGTFTTKWIDGNYENKNPGLAASLSGDVDIADRFKKMAASMTDYVRSGPNSKSARGEKMATVSFVSIRWYYFAGPVAIQVLSLLFGITTVFLNRASRTDVPLWKSSALAVLACQHKKELMTIQSISKDIKEIQDSAKKAEVTLD